MKFRFFALPSVLLTPLAPRAGYLLPRRRMRKALPAFEKQVRPLLCGVATNAAA